MKVYGISGIGADDRMFRDLKLDHEFIPLNWIAPQANESIEAYALRFSYQIDSQSDFAIIGLSFGGLMAVEINKLLHPKLVILVSSVETKQELRMLYRLVGKLNFTPLVPLSLLKKTKNIMARQFGAKNKLFLNEIMNATDWELTKWAIEKLTKWTNLNKSENVVKIHGTNDKLMPCINDEKTFFIDKGTHFMIVDRAQEVSDKINQILRKNK